MNKLENYKVGDKVLCCTANSQRETEVIRVTKTMVVVRNFWNPYTNYQTFRKFDGRDFGPTTKNAYFLKNLEAKNAI